MTCPFRPLLLDAVEDDGCVCSRATDWFNSRTASFSCVSGEPFATAAKDSAVCFLELVGVPFFLSLEVDVMVGCNVVVKLDVI